MEDIVNANALGKTKTISHRPNPLQHLERAGEARAQLATRPRHHGLSRPMKDAQQHPVVDGELQMTMPAIILPLSVSLRLEEAFANILQEGIAISEKSVHGLCRRRSYSIGK